jgi:putative nucleotidyltransferase with HDIG domain
VEAPLELFSGVASCPSHGSTTAELVSAAQSASLLAAASDGEPVALFDQVRSATEDELNARRRRRAMRASVLALAQAVDARDPSTSDHSTNVSELAILLARVLDLPEQQVQDIGLAALLHDVGKVGLSDLVLYKHAELTVEETLEIEEHVTLGESILEPADVPEALPAVRHHHEHWDGSGYPDRLAGDEIPVEARIIAICDRFDVLSSGRGGHAALPIGEALDAVEAEAGTLLDPSLVAAFVRLIHGLRAPGSTGAPTITPAEAATLDAP